MMGHREKVSDDLLEGVWRNCKNERPPVSHENKTILSRQHRRRLQRELVEALRDAEAAELSE